jgi:hypothetical protein
MTAALGLLVPLPPQGIVTVSPYRKVVVNIIYINGWPHQGSPFGRLEPDEGKLSRPVLRGLGAGNSPRLPGALDSLLDKAYDMTYHLDIQKPIY